MEETMLMYVMKQGIVFFVMAIANYAQWHEKRSLQKENKKEREQHKKELKERNDYIIDRDREMRDALKDLIVLQDKNDENTQKLETKIDRLLNTR